MKHIIFDIENLTHIDASATHVLVDMITDYRRRGIGVYFVKCRNSVKPIFLRSGLMMLVGSHCFFRKVGDALRFIEETESNNLSPLERDSAEEGPLKEDLDRKRLTSHSTYRDI